MYCKKCGRKLNGTDAFCPGCGEKTAHEISTNSGAVTVQNVQQDNKTTGIIIGIVVGILVLIGGTALIGGIAFFVISTNGLSTPTTEKTHIYDVDDDVDPSNLSTKTKEINFGSYTISIPSDADSQAGADSIVFIHDELSYEISVLVQNFAAVKNNKEIFIGSKEIYGSTIDIKSADIKEKNGTEYLLLKGTFDDYDMMMLYTKTSAVPYYTVGALCYGEDLVESEAIEFLLPIINSIKINREINSSIGTVPSDFIEVLTDETVVEE